MNVQDYRMKEQEKTYTPHTHTHSFSIVTIENNAKTHDVFTRNQLETIMLFNIKFSLPFSSKECPNTRHIVAKYVCFAVAAQKSSTIFESHMWYELKRNEMSMSSFSQTFIREGNQKAIKLLLEYITFVYVLFLLWYKYAVIVRIYNRSRSPRARKRNTMITANEMEKIARFVKIFHSESHCISNTNHQ